MTVGREDGWQAAVVTSRHRTQSRVDDLIKEAMYLVQWSNCRPCLSDGKKKNVVRGAGQTICGNPSQRGRAQSRWNPDPGTTQVLMVSALHSRQERQQTRTMQRSHWQESAKLDAILVKNASFISCPPSQAKLKYKQKESRTPRHPNEARSGKMLQQIRTCKCVCFLVALNILCRHCRCSQK